MTTSLHVVERSNARMLKVLRMKRWSPYAAGALLGVLSWLAFASTGRLLGVSAALAKSAGRLAGGEQQQNPPELWRARFGASRGRRHVTAFAAGGLVMYGARMAGGCTSGHAISASLQLAVSSWTFFLTIFAVAHVLYGKAARHAN